MSEKRCSQVIRLLIRFRVRVRVRVRVDSGLRVYRRIDMISGHNIQGLERESEDRVMLGHNIQGTKSTSYWP